MSLYSTNSGIKVTMNGSSSVATMMEKSTSRPGQRSREKPSAMRLLERHTPITVRTQ